MQRDFILRLIERLGLLFVAIRKLILGGGEPAEVESQLTSAASLAGYDLMLLRTLDVESILNVVAPGGDVDISRAWILGEILLLDGLQKARLGQVDLAASHLVRARSLFELLGSSASVTREFPEAAGRIQEIDQELDLLSTR